MGGCVEVLPTEEVTQPQDHESTIATQTAVPESETPILTEATLATNSVPLEMEDINDDAIGDEEDDAAPKVQQGTIRKLKHKAILQNFIRNNAEAIIVKMKEKTQENENHDTMTLRQLMAKQESQRIIGSPREYQIELYERAKVQNTIAVLDTGSGKTLIAVMLLRHIIDQELENRSVGNMHRISFFLVDKVTLVFQQHAVLKANLDQEVELLYGQLGTDLWNKAIWEAHFKKNMVIVCTAEILHHCLFHAFITMRQINLLVFDEIHHAKREHPYARILKDFYVPHRVSPDNPVRPRIFGMTASPVDGDAREDVATKARELEILTDSLIATTSDPTIFQVGIGSKRAAPTIIYHGRLSIPFETQLYQRLWAMYNDLGFDGLFKIAKEISASLGPWASDFFWSFAFNERETKKKEAKMMRRGQKNSFSTDSSETTDQAMARLKEAHAYISDHHFDVPTLDPKHLSFKVLSLFNVLHAHFERETDQKCLVFVEQRSTARLLNQITLKLGGPHLRSGMLTGTNTASVDTMKYSHKEQAVTMMKFRKGDYNCLFATSVGEEGIDVPECNLVIRFDPCKSTIQYIQSRGRARKANSKFILLQETGNFDQGWKLQTILESERELQRFLKNSPESRLLDSDPSILQEAVLAPDAECRTYVMPVTGATLTYNLALVILQHFASCLPHDDEDDLTVTYTTTVEHGKFKTEVILPIMSPVHSVHGSLHARKATARRSAAFNACLLLHKGGYLDDNLLPTYTKSLPAMRNALLALNVKNQKQYAMQAKPSLWALDRGSLQDTYYLTIIHLKDPWQRPVQPLGLLTRHPLPNLPSFPIFQKMGQRAEVEVISQSTDIPVDQEKITYLAGFTLAIFKDVYNKTFENAPAKMSYWITPLQNLPEDTPMSDVNLASLIDWGVAKLVATGEAQDWSPDMAPESLIDKFFIDPWDGGRRLFTIGLAQHLKAHDPVPDGVAQGNKPSEKRYKMTSIIDYSVTLFRKARQRRVWNADQPVLVAEKTTHRLNVLADPNDEDKAAITKCFVCPEPLKISLLPAKICAMALIMPAIIHRIESYLIALEFPAGVGLNVTPSLALEALTKNSNNSDDHNEEQINFQTGMGPNYERLEFIGDCFLKMATSISIFVLHHSHDEYAMHVNRMIMLCNRNLLKSALDEKNQWYRYIRGQKFSRRTWYPSGIALLSGKKIKDDSEDLFQQLGDKTIADVCESTIGAALMSHYDTGLAATTQFDNAVLAVHQFVQDDNHPMMRWSDYYAMYTVPKYQLESPNASMRDLVETMASEQGYRFKYPRLLRSAFTHPSQPRALENIPSYQRLEFLGDSLLDMTAVTYLFLKFPTKDPQWLTEHKMAMVSNKFLGAVCVKLGFHRHLRHSQAGVESQIRAYVEELEEAEHQSKGARDYWTVVKDPPKCLPDIVESYAGALFVDSQFNYAEVQRFFEAHIRWFFDDMSIYDTFANDHPVNKLQKLLNVNLGCNDFRLMAQEFPNEDTTDSVALAILIVHDEVVASGQSSGGKHAKIMAARQGMEALDGMAPFVFREKFKCTCVGIAEPEEMLESIGDAAKVHGRIGTAV